MNLLFTIILLTFQSDTTTISWQKVQVDEFLTIELPSNFERTDTLDQSVFYAESDYTIFMLSKVPESAIPNVNGLKLNSTKEIPEFYSGFQKGVLNTKEGRIVESNDILLDSLRARSFRIDLNNEETKLHRAVIVRDRIYLASVWFATDYLEEVKAESVHFFDSFEFSIKPEDQFIFAGLEDSSAYKIGEILGSIVSYSIIPVLLFVFFYRRKKKKTLY